MIVDTSAVIAIILGEPERDSLLRLLAETDAAAVSAGTLLEMYLVVDGRGNPVLSRRLDQLLVSARIETFDVTAEHVALARQAFRDFGRGSGHPARLNYGDCFAYALATATGQPLLFKGEDFTHTDIRAAAR